jgi:hypothetical protein
MTSLSLEDLVGAANPGPRILWTPWTGFINFDKPPRPPVLNPDPFFGRKRRARRFRAYTRQHRAYMANVRAFAERLRAHDPHAPDPRHS